MRAVHEIVERAVALHVHDAAARDGAPALPHRHDLDAGHRAQDILELDRAPLLDVLRSQEVTLRPPGALEESRNVRARAHPADGLDRRQRLH